MQLFFGAEGVWEAYTPSLSPLQALKSLPDPFEVLGIPGPWEIHTRGPCESSESEYDAGSDDGSLSSDSSRSPTEHHLSGEITPVDWGANETFAGLADNLLGLHFAPSQTHAEARAVATPTPQAGSLRAPLNHQDVHSRERPNQKCYPPRRHATPRSYVTASETLVARCLQDTCLLGSVNNASGPKKSQEMSSLREKAHPYGRTKARRNYGPDDWLSSGDPKERADNDDVLSTSVVYAEEFNQLLRAPLMRTVELPDDEETTNEQSEQLLFSGPDLGGWLTGTFDGVPKMVDLDHLDFALSVPFPAQDEGLLAAF